jgi:hypothetical protein
MKQYSEHQQFQNLQTPRRRRRRRRLSCKMPQRMQVQVQGRAKYKIIPRYIATTGSTGRNHYVITDER